MMQWLPKFSFFLIILFDFTIYLSAGITVNPQIVYKYTQEHGNAVKTIADTQNNSPELQIFCRQGDPKLLKYFFRTATLRIISSAEDITLIRGATAEEVYEKYLSTTKWYNWAANLLPWRIREAGFPTFNSSCVGISTSKRYTAELITRPIDPWNIAICTAGVVLFFLSPSLAESTLFFYSSGTLLGALAAVVILLFILSRSIPKGKISSVTLFVLWSVFLYFAGESWNRLEELFHEKLPYILVYLTTGAVIAFITCYRLGPPSHPRTLDIIRWTLQALSLVLIFLSSELKEVSSTLCITILFSYNFASRFILFGKQLWRRAFPTKVRLLTEEEYIAQGAKETAKSLEQLREYCNSPECKTWKIVSRINDPRRFASFMDGSSHLSDDELMAYETTFVEDAGEDSSSEEEDLRRTRQSYSRRNGRGPTYGGGGSGGVASSSSGSRNTSVSYRRGASTSSHRGQNVNEFLTDDEDSMNRTNSMNNSMHTDDEDIN